ncbi:MAG: hypothetical protein ABSH24_34480 [Bryobacteraceae bacterium]
MDLDVLSFSKIETAFAEHLSFRPALSNDYGRLDGLSETYLVREDHSWESGDWIARSAAST